MNGSNLIEFLDATARHVRFARIGSNGEQSPWSGDANAMVMLWWEEWQGFGEFVARKKRWRGLLLLRVPPTKFPCTECCGAWLKGV
ncbi:hypothetical protein HRbin30_03340 [bacterium HR30]|nr:hypothetical protein HRbin30_03340 [bacterium HR30]